MVAASTARVGTPGGVVAVSLRVVSRVRHDDDDGMRLREKERGQ